MKTFRFTWLLVKALYDDTIGTLFSIWYVKVFIGLITTQTVSIRHMSVGIVGAISMGIIIRLMEKPSIKQVFYINLIAYVPLAFLMIGPNVFIIVGAIIGSVMSGVHTVFYNRLVNLNIEPCSRNRFDNMKKFIQLTGQVLGSILALITIFKDVDVRIIWIALYVLFDIPLYINMTFIKLGWMKY